MTEEILLYPGCTIPAKLPYLEAASYHVLEKIGAEVLPFPEFSCCFEPVGLRSLGPDTWLAAGGRLHSLADGRGMLTLCDGCTLSLHESGAALGKDSEESQATRELLAELGHSSQPTEIIGLLEFLHARRDALRNAVSNPQRLRLFLHPGCHCEHVCREKGLSAVEMMSALVADLGAEPVAAPEGLCCGSNLTSVRDELGRKIMGVVLDAAEAAEVDAIVTSCPSCFGQFDVIGRRVPVLHLAEIAAWALGWELDSASMHRTPLRADSD